MKASFLIAGAGLTGCFLAASLSRAGYKVTVIEAGSAGNPSFAEDIRTTALTLSSKDFLEKIGFWEKIEKFASPIKDVYVSDGGDPSFLNFKASPSTGGALGYMVKNSDLKKIALSEINKNPSVRIIDETRYDPGRFIFGDESLSVPLPSGEVIEADLFFACDSRNSPAARFYFSPEIDKTYGQKALTFLIRHEKTHEGRALELFLKEGPLALLPLKDPFVSSVVWTLPSKKADFTASLGERESLYLVKSFVGDFLGDLKLESPLASFPLRAYLTERYFYEKIVLVGDAARLIHPLAGQGLNQSIKDLGFLTFILESEGTGTSALKLYERERKADNKSMYFITDSLNTVFSVDSSLFRFFRVSGLALIENSSYSKEKLSRYAMGYR